MSYVTHTSFGQVKKFEESLRAKVGKSIQISIRSSPDKKYF